MKLEERISLLLEWRERLIADPNREEIFKRAFVKNRWFSVRYIEQMFNAICHQFLNREKLEEWVGKYDLEVERDRPIGLIFAGNIPMVGFHDLLSVIISGHPARIKLSSKDEVLGKWLLHHLHQVHPSFVDKYQAVERLTDFGGVIATGSNNSSRYFEQYFSKVPNIIRKNRTGVGVFDGSETQADFENLGRDFFSYFGLGCRNVSKLFVPSDFDLTTMLAGLESFSYMMHEDKYKNNYDYYRSILLLNQTPHLASDFLMVLESEKNYSPISAVNFQTYGSAAELDELLAVAEPEIQCIVGKNFIPFGKSQEPELWDYADGVDTLQFLSQI